MNKKVMAGLCLACAPMILSGCIDKNYDLADVDSTSRVPVENLTVPMNLDPIRFGDILKPEGKIQIVTIDGADYYALTQSGDFGTDEPIKIDLFNIQAPTLNPTLKYLEPTSASSSVKRNSGIPSFSLKSESEGFSYTASNVPEELVRLDSIKTAQPFNYKMSIKFPQIASLSGLVKSITLKDVAIQLPKGLAVNTSTGSYDRATGLWKIPSLLMTSPSIDLNIAASGINTTPEYADVRINDNRTINFHGDFAIVDGLVELNPVANPDLTQIPSKLRIEIDYSLDSFQVKYISGAIDYKLEGFNIAPASLSDIPDFLKGDQTVARLVNPQIYFQINNPAPQYDIKCSTGITLGAVRDSSILTFSPSENIVITNQYGAGPYSFALAVSNDNLAFPTGEVDYHKNLHFIPFPTLGNLLAPESEVGGLPSEITIDLDNPSITSNNIVDFELGKSYDKVKGYYDLVAPLALSNDSRIIYEKTFDGWYDDALEDLTITALTLTADYTNETPVGVIVRAYPIDRSGNPYGSPEAVVASSDLAAGSSGEFKIELTKESGVEITGLDGVRLYVDLNNPNGQTLSPDQTLELKNLRVTVSGYYQSDFK